MAELADAQRSGRCMDFHVQVRLLSTASQFPISIIGSRQYVYGLNPWIINLNSSIELMMILA